MSWGFCTHCGAGFSLGFYQFCMHVDKVKNDGTDPCFYCGRKSVVFCDTFEKYEELYRKSTKTQ